MTAPAELTPDQLDEVIELVGPLAWAAHQVLPAEQQVDLARSLRVRRTLPLVAAAVLRATAQARRLQPDTSAPQLKRVKEGAEELEYFALPSAGQDPAALWDAQAAALEQQVTTLPQAANPAPILEDWGLR